jgi:hypothetical protein
MRWRGRNEPRLPWSRRRAAVGVVVIGMSNGSSGYNYSGVSRGEKNAIVSVTFRDGTLSGSSGDRRGDGAGRALAAFVRKRSLCLWSHMAVGRAGWRQGQRGPEGSDESPVAPERTVVIRFNATNRSVGRHEVRRVFRSQIGDWCVEIVGAERNHIEVFDHHPRATVLRFLKNSGANIADDVIAEGAEGGDIGRRGD